MNTIVTYTSQPTKKVVQHEMSFEMVWDTFGVPLRADFENSTMFCPGTGNIRFDDPVAFWNYMGFIYAAHRTVLMQVHEGN